MWICDKPWVTADMAIGLVQDHAVLKTVISHAKCSKPSQYTSLCAQVACDSMASFSQCFENE